jgi:protein-S-isoprenylcysteine O-methyltransferase Ste14
MRAEPRWSVLAHGSVLVGGVAFVASLLYFTYAYLGRFGTAVDPATPLTRPVLIDAALFAAFALHHSLFARARAKRRVESLVSPAYERSVYVWGSSLLFGAVCVLWQPIPGALWIAPAGLAPILLAAELGGGLLSVVSARRLDVLDLAGLRQAAATAPAPVPALIRTGPYGLVRHPVYLGWIIFVWVTPAMTGTRLVFAAVSTLYLAVAVLFEERDLTRIFGPGYSEYQRQVRWRMLPFVY